MDLWGSDRDVKRIGVVKGTRVGGTRRPRISGPASECISYFAADKSDARIFHATRTRTVHGTRVAKATPARRDIILQATMGSIHEGA